MLKKRWIATLVVLVAGWFAGVQLALAENREALADKYAPLAGSEANASTLVNGLREGAEFKLGAATFTPPTGKMGNGNIDIALALAQAKLKEQGIANPTPEQLRTALIGDAQHPGVLTLRAEGKGWGYIAHRMGLKLGEVVHAEKAERQERHERTARNERPERPERPEKPERHGR
jgi:hypothetical protein